MNTALDEQLESSVNVGVASPVGENEVGLAGLDGDGMSGFAQVVCQ